MFVSKAGAYPNGAPALHANINLVGEACQGQTLYLIEPVRKFRRKSVENTDSTYCVIKSKFDHFNIFTKT